MGLQKKAKWLLMFSIMTIVVGCGFHLRGNVSFPEEYKTVYIDSNEPEFSRDSIEFYVKRQLSSQLTFVDTKETADLIIHINEGFNTRVVASNASGSTRDYTTDIVARIGVTNSSGQQILPAQNFTKSRNFTINERAPLARTNAEESIARDLAEDLSIDFIRRLITVIQAEQ